MLGEIGYEKLWAAISCAFASSAAPVPMLDPVTQEFLGKPACEVHGRIADPAKDSFRE